MGGTVSRGIDNQSLIDNLVESGICVVSDIERSLRLVDRGEYSIQKNARAYVDLPYRVGSLHLSAPSIYMKALQNFDIQPGHSFLNIGSGTGYFNTVIGLLLGCNGTNHGIEVNEYNVRFSRKRLMKFLTESDAPFERSFCAPLFVHGNIFDLISPVRHDYHPSNDQVTEEITQNFQASPDYSCFSNSSCGPTAICIGMDEDSEENSANCEVPRSSEIQNANNISDIHISEEHLSTNSDEYSNGSREYDDEDDTESEQNATFWSDGFPIGIIHTFNSGNDLLEGTVARVLQWPSYDRIYTGAAITNFDHLKSIINLLKIDGILIAPYCNKFLKVKRISETQIIASELMSVSFANLSAPRKNAVCTITAPPCQTVPTLEQLCARVIRQQLCVLIRQRHSALPTLGRYEKIEQVKSDNQDSSDSNSSTNQTDRKIKEQNHPGDFRLEDNEYSPPTAMTRILYYILNHGGNYINSSDSTNEEQVHSNDSSTTHGTEGNTDESVRDSTRQRNLIRNCWHAFRALRSAVHMELHNSLANMSNNNDDDDGDDVNDNDETDDDNQVNSNDCDETSDATKGAQPPQHKWIPQSYTYKNEMFQILKTELQLSNRFIQSVLAL